MKREKRISVGAVGIALNFILACAKTCVGVLLGLVSVVADGINNLSDCGSGVVLLVSERISKKPADKEHPYGHQRAEYVAALLIGCMILLFAVELLRESVEKCVAGMPAEGAWWLYLVLGASIAVKAGMAAMYLWSAHKTGSDSFRAAATDSICDCIATLVVIVGVFLSHFVSFPVDGYAGTVVALFIGWEGIGVLRDAGSKLLGRAPDPMLVEKIRALILECDGVLGVHDLRVYRFGPSKFCATAHIETDAALSSSVTHETVDGVERKVREAFGVELTAHSDPVALDDGEARELEERIRAAVTGMYENMDLHDFRMVRGARDKVVFEVGVPFDCKAKDTEIALNVEGAVKLLSDIDVVVSVERE